MADYEAGQIVGFKDGAISLDTEDADHLFVISTLPIVLGNAPEETWRYEKAAFWVKYPCTFAVLFNRAITSWRAVVTMVTGWPCTRTN